LELSFRNTFNCHIVKASQLRSDTCKHFTSFPEFIIKNLFIPIIFSLFFAVNVNAQWQPNGVAICDTIANAGANTLPQIATDMNGGAFICWTDGRSETDLDIYMQHIFSDGTVQFPHNGVPLCNAYANQQFPRMISDNKGGSLLLGKMIVQGIRTYMPNILMKRERSYGITWVKRFLIRGDYLSTLHLMTGGD
jgi:hypothetical protein